VQQVTLPPASSMHNARATFAEIGTEVGLSAPAVQRRVDRLVASGAIRGFTALIDPDVLGWQTEAYVEIYCKGTVAHGQLQRSLERVPEVVGAATVSGTADALVHMLASDGKQLERALERIRDEPNVDLTRSVIVLSRLIDRPGPEPMRPVGQDAEMPEVFFAGFEELRVAVGDGVVLRVRTGGSGPPVVLLHGHPRTHTTWHRVAPRLVSAGHTVVCPDLRGYGRSSKPVMTADHAPYSKRAMAGDVLALMRGLGHQRFAVVGHDRGSYVAFRLAMDHPEAVTHLAVLDSIPIAEALDRTDARFAAAWWHWFFFGQQGLPERAITADPAAWYGSNAPGKAEAMGPENHADHLAAISDPATVRAMLEDYRAGLGVDRAADDADRAAGRRVACPTLVLWSSRDDVEELFGDPRPIWAAWTTDLRGGGPIDSGHHMAEDAPEELAVELARFLAM
jgi:haloacetate dehalogenase